MSNEIQPSPAGDNGSSRDARGRFGAGNKLGRGNPYAKRVQEIRAALLEAVDPEAIKTAVLKLMEAATAGDRLALAEVLDRTVGKSIPADIQQQIDEMREMLEQILRERR
jgi:hypothetical protein